MEPELTRVTGGSVAKNVEAWHTLFTNSTNQTIQALNTEEKFDLIQDVIVTYEMTSRLKEDDIPEKLRVKHGYALVILAATAKKQAEAKVRHNPLVNRMGRDDVHL
eukprot:3037290-Amphidinium_carterae.1